MRISEQSATLLVLRPDQRAERRFTEIRRAFPWLVGGVLLGLVLWLLVRMGEGWPPLARGGALTIVIYLVIYFVGGACGLCLILFSIISWMRPLTTCVLDKEAGLVSTTMQGALAWQPVRRAIHPLGELRAVLLWKEHEGPVWLGLQLANKRVKLESASAAPPTHLSALVTRVGQIDLGTQGTDAGQPLSALAEQVSRFLAIPLVIDLGGECLIQLPRAVSAHGGVTPLNCPRCGAPLPEILDGAKGVRCGYCGTNMRVATDLEK